MTRKVVSPIALDKSINTTEQTPRNIADVLAQQLAAIKTAIESGNGNLEAAFVCYYGVTTATQIKDAIEDGKVPYFYYNGSVAQLWKVETDKYTFRTTNTRSVEGQTILDVVDYVVNGSVWSTITSEVSGGSSSGQSYIASVNSLADFDTTGKSGMQDLISVANVPADGVYQVSVMLHITPKTASATKSDLVFHFTSGDGTGWPNHTFHAVVDDSQTFAQQLSFSTSVSLKAGQNTLRIQCGNLNTEYLVFVDELTLAQLVNGVYHNGDDFDEVHTLTEAIDFNNDDGVLVDGATGGPRFMFWKTLAAKVLSFFGINKKSNEEYLYALTDTNGAFLFGIKEDGSVEWSKGVPTPLKIILDGIVEGLNSKENSVNGKSLIDSIFANGVSFKSNEEYIFALVDDEERLLVGLTYDGKFYAPSFVDGSLVNNNFSKAVSSSISKDYTYVLVGQNNEVLFGVKYDGSVVCDSLINEVKKIIKDSGGASKNYVDSAVEAEKQRAENAEQGLQDAIDNIQPTTVIGGENNPDNIFLTEKNSAITLKDVDDNLYGQNIVFVPKGANLSEVLSSPNTSYILRFSYNLNGDVTIPQNCVLIFEGGCVYGGSLIGNKTRIVYNGPIFASNVTIGGTWDVKTISSNMLVSPSETNSLLKLLPLLSDNVKNEFVIETGNFTLNARNESDTLIALKSNTLLRIDGSVSLNPNGYTHYNIVYAENKTNIEITGVGKLEGDADDHDYSSVSSTHEWGMCIEIRNSNNINIHDITLKNATGDGIEISGNNIKIYNIDVDHCGRQGVSVLTAENVSIDNVIINDIYRTAPKAAIDIEPYTGVIAKNISIKNAKISNCSGIQILYCDGVIVENVQATDCDILFQGTDAKNVLINQVEYEGDTTPSPNFFIFDNNCDNIYVDFLDISPDTQVTINIDNVKFGYNMSFNANVSVSGNPEQGTMKYDNGKYILFNGVSWVNMDGTSL